MVAFPADDPAGARQSAARMWCNLWGNHVVLGAGLLALGLGQVWLNVYPLAGPFVWTRLVGALIPVTGGAVTTLRALRQWRKFRALAKGKD